MGATAWDLQSRCNSVERKCNSSLFLKKKEGGGAHTHVLLKGQNYAMATRSTAFYRTRPALPQKHQLYRAQQCSSLKSTVKDTEVTTGLNLGKKETLKGKICE